MASCAPTIPMLNNITRVTSTLRPLHPLAHAPFGWVMGGEAADRVGGLVAHGDLLVEPTPAPAPGTKGEGAWATR